MQARWLSVFIFLLTEAFFGTAIYGQTQQKLAIANIFISGNKITKPEVIYREIPFKQGDSLYIHELKNALPQAKSTLLNTSLFLSVEIIDSVYAEGTLADIYINVSEKWYLSPAFQLQLEDRNFNEWIRHKQLYRTTIAAGLTHFNFRGRNEKLGLDISSGWRESAILRYKIPYLNAAKTLGLSLTMYHSRGHEVGHLTKNNELEFLRVDDRYIYRRTGMETAITYRKFHRLSHTVRVGYDHYRVDDTISRYTNPEFLGSGRNILNIPHIGYQVTYDNRSNAFYPQSGNFLIVYLESVGIPHIYDPVKMLSAELQYRTYFPLGTKFTVASGFRARVSTLDSLPYIYRNSLGYRHQVRGYEHYVADGNALLYIANELRFKAIEKQINLSFIPVEQFNKIPFAVYAKIFMDNGYVNNPKPKPGNTLVNDWLTGWGAGFDVVTYYDKILRLEYSFNNLRQSELFLHYLEVF